MQRVFPLLLSLAVVALDQGVKAWATRALTLGVPRPLLGDAVRLTRVHNPGGAFGLFPQHPGAFVAVSVVLVGALGMFLLLGRWRRWGGAGAGLLLGGAVGNLVDRIRWGYVLDYLEIPWFSVFNVADTAIVAGATLVALAFVSEGRR